MVLPGCSLLSGTNLILSALLSNGSFDLCFLILLEPLIFLFSILLQKDILLSGDVDVLHKVDLSLLLTLPLSLPHLVLPVSLSGDKFIDLLLEISLVVLSFTIVLLELNDFFSSSIFLLLLEICNGLFSGKSGIKKLLIPTLDSLLLDQPEFSLGGIVVC